MALSIWPAFSPAAVPAASGSAACPGREGTLIEALGTRLYEAGRRSPSWRSTSSTLSGGGILGDKSRMETLARQEGAFVRPSPSAATRQHRPTHARMMLLVEAAGFDVVLVETVGVGQSETAARGMVDTIVVLLLPGAGDELQGIKKGILEVGDVLAVNKADGERVSLARAAARDHGAALRYLRPASEHWAPRTLTVSAHTGDGIDELWSRSRSWGVLEEAGALERSATRTRRWM